MSKSKRGKNIKKAGWRGVCPICQRTGVKLLWSKNNQDGVAQTVCKICK